MSLDYRLENIPNWREVCFEGPEGARTMRKDVQNVIFATIAVGLGELSEKTLKEFHFRQTLWNTYHGFTSFSMDFLRSLIGLRTNVSNETRAKWLTRMADGWYHELMYQEGRREKQNESVTA